MYKKVFVFCCFVLVSYASYAQCSMCKSSAESSLKQGNSAAAGLNSGISYLIMVPYMAAAVVGIAFYYHYKKKQSHV